MINEKYYPWLIALVGLVFFVPFLGNVHLFDWDEINFAESAREMIVSGNYSRVQVGFQPFWEKPPLFFWLQSLSMHLFGVNEFAARLPNAVFGSLTLVTIYMIGRQQRNVQFGLLWTLLYFGSILPHMYFKSGIIDPVFNYFIFLGIYFLMLALQGQGNKMRNSALAGIMIGFAVLTKGPVGFLLLLLTFLVVLVMQRFKNLPNVKQVLVFALTAFLVSLFWYGFEMIENGPWFLVEFLEYQVELFRTPVADHAQPFYYHFVVVLLGCFPMSVLALGGFKPGKAADPIAQWMMVLFWVVMILFTIVTTKIVHYSSMAYLPLSFIAADYLFPKIQKQAGLPNWVIVIFVLIGMIFGVLLTALPLVNVFRESIAPLINDPFAVAGIMKDVYWSGHEYIIGVVYLIGVMVVAYLLTRKQLLKGLVVMALNTGLTLFLYMLFVLPKIEAHTQGLLIDFL